MATKKAARKQQKIHTVLVKCMVVDTDGYAVDGDGELIAGTRKKPWYVWEKRSRTPAWMKKYPKMWKPVSKKGTPHAK